MCGHFGVISNNNNGFSASEMAALKLLGYLDTTRGVDASSLTMVDDEGDVLIHKAGEVWHDFVKAPVVTGLFNQALHRGRAVLGHNRKATVGVIDDESAHPFVIDDRYVFNHNGKLQKHESYHKTAVDSEALGKVLCPLSEDIPELEKALSGMDVAMAVVWLDAVEHKLYMLRNKDRPLYFGMTNMGSILYASEKWMLHAAKEACHVPIGEVEEVAVDTLYCLDLGQDLKKGWVKTNLTVKKSSHTKVTTGSTVNQQTLVIPFKKKKTKSTVVTAPTLSEAAYKLPWLALVKEEDAEQASCLVSELSKNAYKREAKQILLSHQYFTVEQVMPCILNNVNCGHLLFGTSPDWEGWSFQVRLPDNDLDKLEDKYLGQTVKSQVVGTNYDSTMHLGIATTKDVVVVTFSNIKQLTDHHANSNNVIVQH
jgi:predicted glutamine amidotransferase